MAKATTYRGRQDSSIYGARLIIHKRGDLDADTYYFRARIAGNKGYIRRSCGTNNAAKAMVFAENAYEDLVVRQKGGFSLTELTVDKFFADWIERKRHNFTASRAKWKKNVYERYMSAYFGKQDISQLTKKFCDGYWEYRLNFWDTKQGKARIELNEKRIGAKTQSSHNVATVASFATLRSEASLINEFLKVATDEGRIPRTIKISAQDAMAKSERGDSYRDTFTEHEWSVLTANLYNYAMCRGRFADKRIHSLHRFQRHMLHTFVLLASSTGMRVGEIKQLRWSDLSVRTDGNGEKIFVVQVRGETSKVRRARSVVAHSSHIIDVLADYRAISKHNGTNDFLFYNESKNGDISTVDLIVAFKKFLRRCDYECPSSEH